MSGKRDKGKKGRSKCKERKEEWERFHCYSATTSLVTHSSPSPFRDQRHAITLYRNISGPMSVIKGDKRKKGGDLGVRSPEFNAVCDHHTLSHGTHVKCTQKHTHTVTWLVGQIIQPEEPVRGGYLFDLNISGPMKPNWETTTTNYYSKSISSPNSQTMRHALVSIESSYFHDVGFHKYHQSTTITLMDVFLFYRFEKKRTSSL